MGWVDYGDVAAGLHGLAHVLANHGHAPAALDYLEQALAAYHKGLSQPLPQL